MSQSYILNAAVHVMSGEDFELINILHAFSREIVLGIDVEWHQYSGGSAADRVDIIQVATLDTVVLIYIGNDKTRIPSILFDILGDDSIVKVGNATADDLGRFLPDNRSARSIVDLSCMVRSFDRCPWLLDVGDVTGLSSITEVYLHESLPFKHDPRNAFNRGSWLRPLDRAHEMYAARDAHAPLRVYNELLTRTGYSVSPSSYMFDFHRGRRLVCGTTDESWSFGDPWHAYQVQWRCVLCECQAKFSNYAPKAPSVAYKMASHYLSCRRVFARKFHLVYGSTYVATPQFNPRELFLRGYGEAETYFCAGCKVEHGTPAMKPRANMEEHVALCSTAFVKVVDYLVGHVGALTVLDIVDDSKPLSQLPVACVLSDHAMFH